jgi:soluble lytic murein transglycosylase-like protein
VSASLYQSQANQVAAQYNIPPSIFSALISKESNWNPYAVNSNSNGTLDVGLAQLNSGTTQGTGVDPYDPSQNLTFAGQTLSGLFDKYGNWTDALSAYNTGSPAASSSTGSSYADSILTAANAGLGDQVANALAVGDNPTIATNQGGSSASGPSFWSDPLGYIKSAGLGLGAGVLAVALIGFGAWSAIKSGSG